MVKVYKVHPSIGIARVGNSPDEFFVSSEVLGGNPVDIVSGVEQPLQKYKDASGHIKRQAARFRVFEYEDDTSGTITPLREITLADAQIEWRVSLANRKASALKWRDSGVRNPSEIDRAELEIKPVFKPISGANQIVTATTPGFFRGKEVYLGELHTDAQGHLLLLGGRGLSSSEPAGQPIDNFANNDDWYDDIADGPIDAQITFPSGETFTVVGGWVIVAPPDFAPKVAGLTTLYDIAFQAAVNQGWLIPPPTPSFRQDILPIIERGANLRWVDEWDTFQPILKDDPAILSSKTNPIADSLRQAVFDQLDTASDALQEHEFTQVQKDILNKWLGKDFVDDFSSPPPQPTLTPSNLDRAALEQGVGGGFNPGIEAGILMTNTAIYTEPFRLTRSPFIDNGSSVSLEAGSITARMAVPWQADFLDCGINWWPSQRPVTVMLKKDDPRPNESWMPSIDYTQLVEDFGRLGFIVPRPNTTGETVFVEDERDPTFPH